MKDKLFRILNTAWQSAAVYIAIEVMPKLQDVNLMEVNAGDVIDFTRVAFYGVGGALLSALSMAWRKRWLPS